MKNEARKTFRHGFVLTEAELVRATADADAQIRKVTKEPVKTQIEARFKNGTISEFDSIDALLQLENIGPSEITRLRIELQETPKRLIPEHTIAITFRNPEQEEDATPISYAVRGQDRDWVLVTASLLEDRIAKIKNHSVRAYVWTNPRPPVFSTLALVFTLCLMGTFSWAIRKAVKTQLPSAATVMEKRWKEGSLHDPIEALIIIQKEADARTSHLDAQSVMLWSLAFAAVVPLALLIITPIAAYLSPAFVFKWGDNAARYDRRIRARNFLLVTIALALAIGIAAGVIANHITNLSKSSF